MSAEDDPINFSSIAQNYLPPPEFTPGNQHQHLKELTPDQLIALNAPLIITQARRALNQVSGGAIDQDDFHQELALAVLEAQKSYNPKKKTKFSTYLVPKMRGATTQVLRSSAAQMIRVPDSTLQAIKKSNEGKGSPDPAQIKETRHAPRVIASLETAILHGQDICLGDLLTTNGLGRPPGFSQQEYESKGSRMEKQLERLLSPEELDIVAGRYGLLEHSPAETIKQLAKKLNRPYKVVQDLLRSAEAKIINNRQLFGIKEAPDKKPRVIKRAKELTQPDESTLNLIADLLAKEPPRQTEVLLKYLRGARLRQIGMDIGINYSTTQSALVRGRTSLKRIALASGHPELLAFIPTT